MFRVQTMPSHSEALTVVAASACQTPSSTYSRSSWSVPPSHHETRHRCPASIWFSPPSDSGSLLGDDPRVTRLPRRNARRNRAEMCGQLVGNRSVHRGQYEESTLGIVEEAGDDRRTRSEEVGCHARWRVANSQPDRFRRVAKEKGELPEVSR